MFTLDCKRTLVLLTLTTSALAACGDSVVTIPAERTVDQGDPWDQSFPPRNNSSAFDMAQRRDLGVPPEGDLDMGDPRDEGGDPSQDMRPPGPSDMAMPPAEDMAPPVDMRPPDPPDMTPPVDMAPPRPAGPGPSDSVETVKGQGCTTAVVKGLSQQLIDEMNCINPGVVSGIDHINALDLYSVVFPYLQTPAARSLEQRMAGFGASSVRISSALRTLPQQYLLYRWYREGRCNIGLAATPGNSNHNGALAIDSPDYNSIKSTLTNNGWRWLGSSDTVHFDYQAGGMDIRSLSVLAFQRLWNRNNPNDKISEDGAYGPQTEGKLKQAPSNGFSIVPWCPGTNISPMSGVASATFNMERDWWTVIAPASVRRVEFRVDGVTLATRERDGLVANFGVHIPEAHYEDLTRDASLLEIDLFDSDGRVVRTMRGRLPQSDAARVRILPVGVGLYAIDALENERARGIEVTLDGELVYPDPTSPASTTSAIYPLGRDIDLDRVRVDLF